MPSILQGYQKTVIRAILRCHHKTEEGYFLQCRRKPKEEGILRWHNTTGLDGILRCWRQTVLEGILQCYRKTVFGGILRQYRKTKEGGIFAVLPSNCAGRHFMVLFIILSATSSSLLTSWRNSILRIELWTETITRCDAVATWSKNTLSFYFFNSHFATFWSCSFWFYRTNSNVFIKIHDFFFVLTS
jgi:hypothetical protein